MDPIPIRPMEIEAPAHDDGTVVAGARKSKKRSLDEVVPPAFVEEDDGAYDVVEMPKRFVLANHHPDKYCGMMSTCHAMEVRITALNESVRRSTAALLQRLRAQDAARAAAKPPGTASS